MKVTGLSGVPSSYHPMTGLCPGHSVVSLSFRSIYLVLDTSTYKLHTKRKTLSESTEKATGSKANAQVENSCSQLASAMLSSAPHNTQSSRPVSL